MDPDLEALAVLDSHLASALGEVTAEKSGWPTPCADWDLTDLVDHVVGGNWFTAKILGGQAANAALTEVKLRLKTGPPSLGAATASIRDQSTAFKRPEALERTWHHVAGDLTGRQILRLRLHDLIIHTWDIRQTLDPPASLPDPLVEWGLMELTDPESLTAKHFEIARSYIVDADGTNDATTYLRSFDRQG